MVTSGHESVLVRSPDDADWSAIGREVGIRSARDGADILGFGSDSFLIAALGDLGSVFAFETVVAVKACRYYIMMAGAGATVSAINRCMQMRTALSRSPVRVTAVRVVLTD
jgi:hypothetical protein